MELMKSAIKKMLNSFDLYAPWLLRKEGLLKDAGWFRSFREKAPLDAAGNPLPWVTYSFMDFIAPRLTRELDLFEFGSGNSTLFYSGKVKSVTVVEHDKGWHEAMKGKIPGNVTLIFKELSYGGDYSGTAVDTGNRYDIVIVDGRDRVNCVRKSLPALKESGVLVLDDSERDEYLEGAAYLREKGFREIPFWGMAPGLLYRKCTSVFYRDGNCLGI